MASNLAPLPVLDRTDLHIFGNNKKDNFDNRFTIFLKELFIGSNIQSYRSTYKYYDLIFFASFDNIVKNL